MVSSFGAACAEIVFKRQTSDPAESPDKSKNVTPCRDRLTFQEMNECD